jgi:hypothetical protein
MRRNYKAYPHITSISWKSNYLRFRNWRCMSIWFMILPLFTARLRNFLKWHLPLIRCFECLSTWKLIHAAAFSAQWAFRKLFCMHPPPRASIQRFSCLTTPKTRDVFVRRKAVSVLVWVKSGEKAVAAGRGHFESKSREICAEGKLWVTDAEKDHVSSSVLPYYRMWSFQLLLVDVSGYISSLSCP